MGRCLIIAYSNYIRDGRLKRHVAALAERGDEVSVICLSEAESSAYCEGGVRLFSTGMPRYRGSSRGRYLLGYLRFFMRAAAMAVRLSLLKPYDVVIVCSMPDATVLCALPLRLFGSRIIVDMKDTMPELYREKFGGRRGAVGARLLMLEERASAFLADRVFAVHEPHRARLEAAGIPPRKIQVVMNAPDPRLFSPLTKQRASTGHFELVCHGTVTRRLGLEAAFKALNLLRDKIPAVRLTVIGGGDYLEKAKNAVAAMKLEDRVSFLPSVPIEELVGVLKRADAGLVPNTPGPAAHLMLPVKMLEYAALGIPIIAARLWTIRHYFPEDAARLFESGDPGALAEAIEELYKNRELGAKLARRAFEVVESMGWDKQRQAYLNTVDSLLISADSRHGSRLV